MNGVYKKMDRSGDDCFDEEDEEGRENWDRHGKSRPSFTRRSERHHALSRSRHCERALASLLTQVTADGKCGLIVSPLRALRLALAGPRVAAISDDGLWCCNALLFSDKTILSQPRLVFFGRKPGSEEPVDEIKLAHDYESNAWILHAVPMKGQPIARSTDGEAVLDSAGIKHSYQHAPIFFASCCVMYCLSLLPPLRSHAGSDSSDAAWMVIDQSQGVLRPTPSVHAMFLDGDRQPSLLSSLILSRPQPCHRSVVSSEPLSFLLSSALRTASLMHSSRHGVDSELFSGSLSQLTAKRCCCW
jgi:hypothetical protein